MNINFEGIDGYTLWVHRLFEVYFTKYLFYQTLLYLGNGGMGESEVVQGVERGIAGQVGGEGEGGREAGEDGGGGGGGGEGGEEAWIWRFCQLVRGGQKVHWNLQMEVST